jgi:nucleotide-binding universal stress UspA family protein
MKILVGVDGSEASTRAVEWCAEHAGRLGAEVLAVHAIDLPLIVSPMVPGFKLPEFKPADREELTRIATEQWCAPLAKASVEFRVVLEAATPPCRSFGPPRPRTRILW